MTTFSSRVQESAVQLVEPVQTASPSRTTYLWCIRSGVPGIDAVGKGSVSRSSGSARERRRHREALCLLDVVDEPDGDAAAHSADERVLDDRSEHVGR